MPFKKCKGGFYLKMRKNRKYRITIFLLFPLALGTFIFLLLRTPGFIYAKEQFGPNILLITIDALRADHLGCYGYKRNTSPNVDKLSEEGALFTQAITQSSHTPTSFGSLATGTYFSRHHARKWGFTLNPSLPTMAEILKKNGYKTIFISLLHFKNLHGFNRGFDVFLNEDVPQDITIQSTIKQLVELKNKKFFLWMHYMGTHHPLFFTREDLNIFLKDKFYNSNRKLPIMKDYVATYGFKSIPKSYIREQLKYDLKIISRDIIKEEQNNPDFYIAQYDASIRFLDSKLNLLFAKLKELNLYENTIIIITADHGEMLGEHGFYFHHGVFLYEPLIKVPLIIKLNNFLKRKVITQQIEASVDIMPTIFDAVDIKTDADFDGQSLIPLILNENGYFKEFSIIDEGDNRIAIRTPNWKLIQTNEKNGMKSYELYNLNDDPKESVNLVKTKAKIFQWLKKKLDIYSKQAWNIEEPSEILDERSKERLKSLGYIQ